MLRWLSSIFFVSVTAPAFAAVWSGVYSQKLDHENPRDPRRFEQRYHLDSSFAEGPDSPVIFLIGGEGYAEAQELNRYLVRAIAKHFKAHRIVLEHRFYGESQPFPAPTVADYKYLTVEQALADLAEFQKFAMGRHLLIGKWIAIGGSYPGGLAALYRLRRPDLVVGAYASSPGLLYHPVTPLDPAKNFPLINVRLDPFTAQAIGPACAADFLALNQWVAAQLFVPEKFSDLKRLINAEEITDPYDFNQAYRMIVGAGIQYGAAESYCEAIAGVSGETQWSRFAAVANLVMTKMGIALYDLSYESIQNPRNSTNRRFLQTRPWYYQKCAQFGWFGFEDDQTGKYWCHKIYGITDFSGIQKAYNELYLPLLDPRKASNIYFTNGTLDVVSAISISEYAGNTTNPKNEYFTIQGGTHCADMLRPANPSVEEAQRRFIGLAEKWLSL